ALAGSDSLPPVLPVNQSLLYPFEPFYYFDTLLLTLDSVSNDVVNFSFANNTNGNLLTSSYRVFGQFITITQNWIIPPILINVGKTSNGAFQFGFTNNQHVTFSVLASTNLSLPPANWSAVGSATNLGDGVFQFAAPVATHSPQMFYRVSSP
ncbi:MAG TPA: hypothetical protein VL970_01210, partial [Candidatus Acidoferrales bacterium]|nr:hypothetical protein [Candidatus Acidoferrales bacterium]